MLSHCANSQCSKPFLRLGQGKLFLVETEVAVRMEDLKSAAIRVRQRPRLVERYWLCDVCAEVWTLVHDRKRGIVLVALPREPVGASVARAEEYRESV